MTTPNKRLLGIIIGVCALLTIPFFAMRFGVDGVDWKLLDFILAGIMLFGAGFAIEIALRVIKKFEYRVATCVGILVVLALVWAELAVGLFGSPIAGN